MRAGLDQIVEFLRLFASPTGARASVLMMTGGLVVLGFLFLVFVFRSTIVGDIAPRANGRRIMARARLPLPAPLAPTRGAPERPSFQSARQLGRSAKPTLDSVFETFLKNGVDARIIQSQATWKRIRVYRCPSCAAELDACESERGLIAGAFETLTSQLAKVEETACVAHGAAYCEFDVRHATLVRVMR